MNKTTSKLGPNTTPGKVQEKPVYCLGGTRHKGGVTLIQALVWNAGTCRSDDKGDGAKGLDHLVLLFGQPEMGGARR